MKPGNRAFPDWLDCEAWLAEFRLTVNMGFPVRPGSLKFATPSHRRGGKAPWREKAVLPVRFVLLPVRFPTAASQEILSRCILHLCTDQEDEATFEEDVVHRHSVPLGISNHVQDRPYPLLL